MKPKLIKLEGEIDKSIIIAGDFILLFQNLMKIPRQKISKDTEELNTINQYRL